MAHSNIVLKKLLVDLSPGSALWLVGWLMNVHSDHILRNLRKPGETGYKIPTGRIFSHENTGLNSFFIAASIKPYTSITSHNQTRRRK